MKKIILLILFPTFIYGQVNELNNIFQNARNFEQSADYEKAESLYKELTLKQPDNNLFFESLNRVLIQQKKYDESINLLEERKKKFPGDIKVYGLLGSTYIIRGEIERAYDTWNQSLNINPVSAANYRLIANYAIENRAIDKAIEILERGRINFNDPTLFSFDLASLYSSMMRFDKAINEYCNILLQQPDQLNSIKARIGNYLYRSDALNFTIDYVETFIITHQTVSLFELLIHLYKYAGQFNKAFDYLKRLTEKYTPPEQIVFDFAKEAYDENQYKTSFDAFELFINHYPNSLKIDYAKLGHIKNQEALIQSEDPNDSKQWKPFLIITKTNTEKYRSVVDQYFSLANTSKVAKIVCESYLRIGLIFKNTFNQPDSADNLFNLIINTYPVSEYSVEALVQLADDAIRQNRLDEAKQYLQKTPVYRQNVNSQKIYADYLMAKIEFWQFNFQTASKLLSEFANDLSNELSNEALELLLVITTLKTDSLNLSTYSSADLLLYQQKYNDALYILEKLSLSGTNTILKGLSIFRTAQILISKDEFLEAITLLKEMLESNKTEIFADEAMFLLAQTYQFGIKNSIEAFSIYENLLAKYPNSLYLDKARENIMFLKPNY